MDEKLLIDHSWKMENHCKCILEYRVRVPVGMHVFHISNIIYHAIVGLCILSQAIHVDRSGYNVLSGNYQDIYPISNSPERILSMKTALLTCFADTIIKKKMVLYFSDF